MLEPMISFDAITATIKQDLAQEEGELKMASSIGTVPASVVRDIPIEFLYRSDVRVRFKEWLTGSCNQENLDIIAVAATRSLMSGKSFEYPRL